MFNALFNLLGFALFVLILVGAFWLSAIFAIVLFSVLLAGYVGLRIWSYLVRKEIVNPRPSYGAAKDDSVIDAEYSRVDVRIEERKN
ncbi:MAG: hypothetical protein J0M34_01510 [Alphaproteobacteria bacterium]|nr:hypothetical protein [Alphaproteobacteria bacterium]